MDNSPARYGAIAYAILNGIKRWVLDNKPYIVAIVMGVTAAMQADGTHIPGWLYGVEVALGLASLHSSNKSA